MHAMHLQEVLIFHFVVVVAVAAAATVTWVAVFFDFDEQHFERETLVGEDMGEMDEFFEDIEQRPLFRTTPPRNNLPALVFALHKVFANDDRFDNKHMMLFEKR